MSRSGIPGSILTYNTKGKVPKLRVKVFGKEIYTGLDDNPQNRKICKQLQKEMYLRQMGLSDQEKRSINIDEAFREYEENYLANKALRTYKSYKDSYQKIVKKDLALNLENIKDILYDFISTNKSNLSNTSINLHIRQFKAFINWCVDQDYISPMSFKRFKQTEEGKEIRIYTEDEINALLFYFNDVDPEFGRLIDFMLNTGSRITETLNLTWNDIGNSEIYFRNKTIHSFESVPINSNVKILLSKQSKRREKIFRWQASSRSRLTRRLTIAMNDLEIEKKGRAFHEFRKTFLYRLFQAGTPLEIASKLMRHNTIQITMKYYAYFDKSILQNYIETTGKKFG